MTRMINPHLKDRVDRIIRDSRRKLGWDDRLIGTMRMALAYDIPPRCYSLGAAAAVDMLLKEQPRQTVASLLESLWAGSVDTDGCRGTILASIEDALVELGSSKPG
jgi:mannitol-1-phosphate/altronate dehydrogenase